MAEVGLHAQSTVAVRLRLAAGLIPLLLLLVALLISLGHEFVNRLHDLANEVATVIYGLSLPVQTAVVWSGSSPYLLVMNALISGPRCIATLRPIILPVWCESPTK